jgi:hypothetical protein
MYVKNNYLVFGICCHHPLHPVTIRHRLAVLMGLMVFSLTMTNAVYLYFFWGMMGDRDHSDTDLMAWQYYGLSVLPLTNSLI